ncbi:MAG: hypothetical protein A2902_00465 [Elusimicrobia bacterium RIFCSPLOWO2_01_FULL_64_13]|nr:MAG: hypothetical protein A2636_00900 [Elusimicrobia bacterium RIFCSPHIGHO2_01_FULL_64_10]OGR97346.1 MAG: hypothetical protein A2902_00465 [Elusimicrobia bacterium RIFCSPLOWO2_01_FULL_64_13]
MPLRAPRGFIREDDSRVSQIGHPAPPWLVNYADLMTEMVAFFVILYALGAALNKDVISAKQSVQEMMDNQGIEGNIEITKDGMRITMQESGKTDEALPFFESGKADLTPRMVSILDQLSPKLKDLALKKHELIIEGHTDNVPVRGGAYRSNWELSSARATVVLKYLVEKTDFPPNMIGALGYGEHRPEAPNDSEESKRKNRRVVFFVKNPQIQTFNPKGSEP